MVDGGCACSSSSWCADDDEQHMIRGSYDSYQASSCFWRLLAAITARAAAHVLQKLASLSPLRNRDTVSSHMTVGESVCCSARKRKECVCQHPQMNILSSRQVRFSATSQTSCLLWGQWWVAFCCFCVCLKARGFCSSLRKHLHCFACHGRFCEFAVNNKKLVRHKSPL